MTAMFKKEKTSDVPTMTSECLIISHVRNCLTVEADICHRLNSQTRRDTKIIGRVCSETCFWIDGPSELITIGKACIWCLDLDPAASLEQGFERSLGHAERELGKGIEADFRCHSIMWCGLLRLSVYQTASQHMERI